MASVASETIVLQLARYGAALKYDDLPLDVVNQTKLFVLDQLGVELALEWTQPVLKLIQYAPSTKFLCSNSRRPFAEHRLRNSSLQGHEKISIERQRNGRSLPDLRIRSQIASAP